MKIYALKNTALVVSIIVFTLVTLSLKKPIDDRKLKKGYVPKEGFVPNESTAIKIAEAVWYSIQGTEIYRKKPFKAKIENGIWYVEGSLPNNSKGGTPYIEIQKSDGKILKVIFEK